MYSAGIVLEEFLIGAWHRRSICYFSTDARACHQKMVDAGPLRSLSLLCSECAIYISKNKRGAVTELNDRSLSRRKCFGLAATASLGSGILVAERLSASIFQSPAGETNKNQQS